MSESFFFLDVQSELVRSSRLVRSLEELSSRRAQQMYVIDHPLGNQYSYDYAEVAIVLIPNHKICLLNFGEAENNDAFEMFKEDLIEDLASLSDRFEYKKHLGRPREWNKLLVDMHVENPSCESASEFVDELVLNNRNHERVASLLISLLLGSINNVELIGVSAPDNYLDSVKNKIILFDGDQSRFIYEPIPSKEKCVKIQGLAGTGKTELLLHKLRELYTKKSPECPEPRIMFTCFNKILAKKMRERIPEFFNFMKVQEQIDWNKRLWVAPSWGSADNSNSGLYSYVCKHYGLRFEPLRVANTFEEACRHVIEALEARPSFSPCFDYVLIDEAQDFGECFFEMCKLITSQTVYIAGDVFQNIFDTSVENRTSKNDYLLNRCYRTDHRTLMFAHALGMGLCEKPVIRWLQKTGWENCGYDVKNVTSEELSLSRRYVRQLSDADCSNKKENKGIYVGSCNKGNFSDRIIKIIENLKKEHPTIEPDDVAIVFPDSGNDRYLLCDELVRRIRDELEWDAVKGYETKGLRPGAVFISNRNNIKGLEFPFVICFCMGRITSDVLFRNALYMILTRSFLSTYFLFDCCNDALLDSYRIALQEIVSSGQMTVRIPSQEEIAEQKNKIEIAAKVQRKSLDEIFSDVLGRHPDLSNSEKQAIKGMYMAAAQSDGISEDDPEPAIERLVDFYQTSLKI